VPGEDGRLELSPSPQTAGGAPTAPRRCGADALSETSYCAGIDVGTTKICTVIGRKTDTGELDILGVGTAPSAGLKAGIIVDREDAITAIRASVESAREMAQLPLRAAYVGITGDHVRSTNVVGRVHTGPRGEITAEDVEQARQSAVDSVPCPVDREIVHTVVREYSVDGASGVSRPIGMSGRRLDVLLHVVTGMSTTIANVRSCVEAVGIEVRAHVLEPIATGRAVLTDAERDLGVLLVDIGGGTSDVAVFVDNSTSLPRSCGSVPPTPRNSSASMALRCRSWSPRTTWSRSPRPTAWRWTARRDGWLRRSWRPAWERYSSWSRHSSHARRYRRSVASCFRGVAAWPPGQPSLRGASSMISPRVPANPAASWG